MQNGEQRGPAKIPSGPPPFNGEQVVKAAEYFFSWYCQQQNVPPDDVPRLNPGHFIQWLRQYDFAANNPFAQGVNAGGVEGLIDGVSQKLRIPAEAVAFIMRLGESATGLAHLSGFWPHLVLKNRATEHPIRSVQFMLIIQWADDTVMPLNRMAHSQSNAGIPIKDAEVVQLLSTEGSQLAHHVLGVGCDAMHDQHQQFKGLGSPDTLTKVMLACEDAVKNSKITPADLTKIGQLVTYIGSLFPREIPKRVLEGFAAQKAGNPLPVKPGVAGWNG